MLLKKTTTIIGLLFSYLLNAQTDNLKVGDVPKSFILPSYKNTVDVVSFPYESKLIYLRFWATDSLNSQKDFFKLKRIYKRNLNDAYKTSNGFDVVFVSLSDNREKWEEKVKNYKLDDLKNYIALKGFNDYFIKQYKLQNIPLGLFINENGNIESMNPTLEEVETAIENHKLYPTKNANNITGKIKQDNSAGVKIISNEMVYVTNIKKDTIQKVMTNSEGVFVVNNVKNEPSINLNISASDKIDKNQALHLENEGGEIMDDFNHTPTGYYVTLSKGDINDMGFPKEMKNLFFSENLFKSGQNTLSEDTKLKLDNIISVLENDETINVEILSHTDCKGDATLNQKLSEERANLCATYLARKGISKSRISTTGFGESQPLNKCIDGVSCSEVELEKNRRVEFKFFKVR